jgi:hypothetical protein
MKRLAIAAAALAPFAQIPRAAASPCGGSHGGGGGGGGPGGGSHHDSCKDDSAVVGFRPCTSFGDWGGHLEAPHVAFEAGVIVRQFDSLLDGQTGTVSHGSESFTFRTVMPVGSTRRSLDTAVLSTMRASFDATHGLYSAVEFDLGGLTQPGRASMEMMSTGAFGAPDLSQRGGLIVDSLAAVGFRGQTHAGSLGIEMAGGMRAVSYHFHSSYHDCEQMTTLTAFGAIAEARARGELWLSPWVTAGATIGTSVIENHTWMGGVYLGFHTRAFGGTR